MTQLDSETSSTTTDTSEHDSSEAERQAYAAEGLDPNDPAIPEGIARVQRALHKLARERGADRVKELAADNGLQIDIAL